MKEATSSGRRGESGTGTEARRATPVLARSRETTEARPGSNGGRPAAERREETQMEEVAAGQGPDDRQSQTDGGTEIQKPSSGEDPEDAGTWVEERSRPPAPPVPQVRERRAESRPTQWGETPSSKISVQNLDFWYGDRQVLFGNDLEVAERCVTAIIGPSGCGKSTHIRVYNRMFELYREQRASGIVLLDGQDLLDPGMDLIDLRRRVGMIFQRPTPFPMSVFDNVAYGLRLHYRISRSKLEERVEAALRDAALWEEVEDKLDEPGTALSGGQQQRLCIARAIAVEPEVLLMDEPTSAVDPVATAKLEELVESLKDQYTIVIVTHNMQQAARISDFTAFFYKGYVVEFGPTERIFTNPSQKQTEDYITGRFG